MTEDIESVAPDHGPRTERLAELLAEIGNNLAECFTGTPARYVLAECSVFDDTVWLTTHDSPDDAVRYHDTQEHPQDWVIWLLIDLDTGMRFAGETETTFHTSFSLDCDAGHAVNGQLHYGCNQESK